MNNFDVTKLNVKDKVKLVHGNGAWHTNAVGNLTAIMMTDGPHGLRKQGDNNRGINDSARATCFPTASAVASSFNRRAAARVAQAIADEAIAQGVDVVLGPGVNIKRSPLCGRNFEYFSEDPYLAGELATSYVNAMQARGVGCCVKHFAVNSQETRRMTVNAVVDERALREIYLAAFENVVTKARPFAVMASYNKINGRYATENEHLYSVLRDEWGYDGLVMSDWGACYDSARAYSAGLDLEMPDGGKFHEDAVIQALADGRLAEADLDRACANVARLADRCQGTKTEPPLDYLARHNEIAESVAEESAVLLKNDGILPLSRDKKYLVVGELAAKPRYQGAGSSHVNAVCRSFLDILTDNGIDFDYAQGYSVKGDTPNVKLEEQAVEDCCKYDAILFFGGLTDDFEGEGYDRATLDIPSCQQRLLDRLHTVNKNIVFVVFGGSPYVMPWLNRVKALLNMYLGGQAVMQAAYKLLFGLVSPSGRLAETFPVRLSDTPCYNYFANDRNLDEHRESIFVGYRYYNTYGVKTQYPFGYGLSYASFKYGAFAVNKTGDGFNVSVEITNTSNVDAYEAVQVYVDNCDVGVMRAKRELRSFDKVFIEAGASVTVDLPVDNRAFAVYCNGKWQVASGEYVISVCRDCETPILSQTVTVEGVEIHGDDRSKYPSYFEKTVGSFSVSEQDFYRLANRQKQEYPVPKRGEFTLLNTFEDMQSVPLVKAVLKHVRKAAIKQSPSKTASDPVAQMIINGALTTPLISLMSVGGVPAKYVMLLLHNANREHGKAFKALFGRI